MSFKQNWCHASCPLVTMTIQPPPFVLTIPGPSMYCPNQSLWIEQCNPCVLEQEVKSHELYRPSSAAVVSDSNVTSKPQKSVLTGEARQHTFQFKQSHKGLIHISMPSHESGITILDPLS
uniref:Uncharacterized protein n=1 Tax=Sphaerodactylus townsendi TaxID=933632 RepID=A0ACB8G6L4_9SAUR